MGSMSLIHWLILAAIVLILFGGRGKISDIMGDFASGIKSFRKGLSDHDDDERPRTLADQRRDETVVNKDQTVGR